MDDIPASGPTEWVERDYSGPARVSGSAGTGKTIVALHRAVHLARASPDARVLLATFSDTLANALNDKLRRLISNQPSLGERLEVCAMDVLGERLYEPATGPTHAIVVQTRSQLQERGLVTTRAGIYQQLTGALIQRKHPPFEFAVIDEAQDISVAQLRFLAAFGAKAPNALSFSGDLGQRIFQQPFSWKSLGVDIRGRARTLHINYRTSHQIHIQADRLLGPEVPDVDGNTEDRRGTVSVFNGPDPEIRSFSDCKTPATCPPSPQQLTAVGSETDHGRRPRCPSSPARCPTAASRYPYPATGCPVPAAY